MKNKHIQDSDELRFENELLKLKIQAELGASPVSVKDIPPEIENFFLKNIINIENTFAQNQTITLFEKVGSPLVPKADELDDPAIELATIDLINKLTEKGVFITFPQEATFRHRYTFITETLFNVQVGNFEQPEIMMHFNCQDPEDDDSIQIIHLPD